MPHHSGAGSGIDGWLEAISADQVAPAAGSAAALAGALGCALLIKLARRAGEDDSAENEELLRLLVEARDELLALAERDAEALAFWPTARQDEPDALAPKDVLDLLLSVPRQAAQICREALRTAQPLLDQAPAVARPDARVGLQLLLTCQGAMESLIQANLERLAPRE